MGIKNKHKIVALKQPRKVAKLAIKMKNKGGRPRMEIRDEQKMLAIQYVTTSGLWKVRLAKFLRVDYDTLNRILKRDKSFSDDLEAADAVFIGKTVAVARPEFILRTKYKEEFPDKPEDVQNKASEEIREVIFRIRKILPASGQ